MDHDQAGMTGGGGMDGSHALKPRTRWAQTGCGTRLAEWQANHARRTGLTARGLRAWTDDEVSVLRSLYPDYAAIERALPHRTRTALEQMAAKLGIVRNRFVWTAAEVTRLKAPYKSGVPVSEILALVPGKTREQVWRRAGQNGWRRPRKPPRPTRWQVLTDVRQRAFDLNITMSDLDAMIGSGSYFRNGRGLVWRHIGRAIALLDGQVEIRWSE